ncbi:MAG: hypothetical protein OEY83_06455 [Candidatus Bathyarchaeota archaeon]|nr:hypothetical protein [Candidatus Bathyarchaeota archaeon]MDH5713560.1 hypothetical protein [Candidatus Bathyarchaeota archaeon]
MPKENKSLSWEYRGCRNEANDSLDPGKRACHLTCNPCLQPENWTNCNDCEVVGHCRAALDRIKNSSLNRGHYYTGQLTGEESMYHVLHFVNRQQNIVNKIGKEKYMKELRQENHHEERRR